MTAPRAALGRYCMGAVRNSKTRATIASGQQPGELRPTAASGR